MTHGDREARPQACAGRIGDQGRLGAPSGGRLGGHPPGSGIDWIPQIKPTVDVLRLPNGSVAFALPGDGPDLAVKAGPLSSGVIDMVDGRRTAWQIALASTPHSPEQNGVIAALATLRQAGVVEDATDVRRLPSQEIERYDRQLRYLRDLAGADDSVSDMHAGLRTSHVAILGLGGLGSWAAAALASSGVGTMTLIDDDVVDVSNLARQNLYQEADVGRPKTEAAAQALSRLRSDLRLRAYPERIDRASRLADLLCDADVVLASADWPPGVIDRWAGEAAWDSSTTLMHLGQHPPLIRIGPLLVPGVTACVDCREQQLNDLYPHYEALAQQRASRPSPASTFAGTSAALGGLAATEIVHYLTGIPPATLSRAVIFDVRTLQRRVEHWQRFPGCTRCAASAD